MAWHLGSLGAGDSEAGQKSPCLRKAGREDETWTPEVGSLMRGTRPRGAGPGATCYLWLHFTDGEAGGLLKSGRLAQEPISSGAGIESRV